MTRRSMIILAVLAAASLLAILWSYASMAGQRSVARRAEIELADSLSTIRRIEQLSSRPVLAAEHEKLASEITSLIERAARMAGIRPQSLSRIEPAAPRRLGETAYKEKPTQVILKDVTLRQLVILVHDLTTAEPGLHASSIRISSPRRDETGDQWAAELTFTYLIYDPPSVRKTEAGIP